MKPEIHCLSLNCPERFSLCCSAKITEFDKDLRGICSKCKKPWQGGACTAGDWSPTDNDDTRVWKLGFNDGRELMLRELLEMAREDESDKIRLAVEYCARKYNIKL
jgi:hypothetical protein